MTTVGYGDISPETDLGRVGAIFVMLVGIGFLTLVIGAVSQRFISTELEQEVAAAERDVEEEVDAARDELLVEIREIGDRLRQVEARLQGVGR